MNLQIHDDGTVEVRLSKRNLDTLVGLFFMACRQEAVPAIHRRTATGMLTVIVEPDIVHYARPEGGPGSDPLIEAALAAEEN
jgi:hypothetical protein